MKVVENETASWRRGLGWFAQIFSAASLIFYLAGGISVFAQIPGAASPRVFLLNPQFLRERRQLALDPGKGNENIRPAIARLETEAQKALKTKIASIVTKQAMPPSGDKHDYMSQAPYFWKNPDTPDGFPYVRRDGERNPEIKKYPDHDLLDQMVETSETLALAYYFTGKEEYAAGAAAILRMWFLDAATKMNPHLEYAQAIPGASTGRGIGIIESRGLVKVVDAVGLLENSRSWTRADQAGLREWFSKFLEWLTTSKNGREESAARNNHGTFYDVQAASFALFVEKKELARQILEAAKQKRLARQIAPDGSQPLELERTRSWDYSVMNLDGLIALAELGESAGVDLWNFKTPEGGGIRRAIEFLFRFVGDEKSWKHQQIESLKAGKLFPLVRRGARKYADVEYMKMLRSLPPPATDDRSRLVNF